MRIASAAAAVLLIVLGASVVVADHETNTPLSPTNANIVLTSFGRGFLIRWSDVSNNESHFNVSRRDSNGNWEFIYSVGTDATSYTDMNIPTTISIGAYMISACNSSGCSMPAETNHVTLPSGAYTPPPLTPPPPPPNSPPPMVDLKVNGLTLLEQATMQTYTVSWNSSEVQSCELSWVNTDPPGNSGDDAVDPNVPGSKTDNDFAVFTLTCIPKGGGTSVSKSVAIKRKVATPSLSCTLSFSPQNPTLGSSFSTGWSAANATGRTYVILDAASVAVFGPESIQPSGSLTDPNFDDLPAGSYTRVDTVRDAAANTATCSRPFTVQAATPGPPPPLPPPSTPPSTVDLKVNGLTLLEQATMQTYTVTWNSSGVQSCELSWVNTDPPGNSGDDDVDPNVSGSKTDNDFAVFTLTCIPKGGGTSVSKSVTISKKTTNTQPSLVDIKFNDSDGPTTSFVGSMVKAGWTLQNVTGCQLVQTGPKPLSQQVSTTYWTDVLMTSSHVGTTVLTITCQKPGGGAISDSATLVVAAPVLPPTSAPPPPPLPPPVPAYSSVERELETTTESIQSVPVRPSSQQQFEQVGRDIRRFEQTATAQQTPNLQDTLNPTLAQPGITDTPGVIASVDALQERGGLGLYTDFDRDGVSDYDEVNLYGSDPRNAYTAGDILTDGERIGRGLDVLSRSLERIPVESPLEAGTESASIFEVVAIRTERFDRAVDVLPIASAPPPPPSPSTPAEPVASATVSTDVAPLPAPPPPLVVAPPPFAPPPPPPVSGTTLVFEGRALPNSFVTLYIFSTPVVVTVKTDEAGNWKYALDRELEDGSHELYVAMVNNDGRIVAKSPAVPFIKQAEAVEFIPLLAPPITEPTLIDTLRNNLMVLGGLALFIFATVALGIVGLRRTEPPGAAA